MYHTLRDGRENRRNLPTSSRLCSEFWLILAISYIMCGDLNARCGKMDIDCEDMPSRKVVDEAKG